MGQVSRVMRRATDRWLFWCPGCRDLHAVGDGWAFNGNIERPTFSPSILVTGGAQRDNAGEIKRDASGNVLQLHCHSFLEDGRLRFLSDCHHELAGQTVALPELPDHLRD